MTACVPTELVDKLVERNKALASELAALQERLRNLQVGRTDNANPFNQSPIAHPIADHAQVATPQTPQSPSTPVSANREDENTNNEDYNVAGSDDGETRPDEVTPALRELRRRIIEASSQVAKQKLLPAGARANLALQTKLVSNIRKDVSVTVLGMLMENESLRVMRHVDSGSTVLHVAAQHGATAVIETILGLDGVDVFATDLCGKTALHVAAEGLHLDACRLLKDNMSALIGEEPIGERAPQDIAGLTPAGRSAMKRPKTAGEKVRRTECTKLLHRLGDSCISPKVARGSRSQHRNPNTNTRAHGSVRTGRIRALMMGDSHSARASNSSRARTPGGLRQQQLFESGNKRQLFLSGNKLLHADRTDTIPMSDSSAAAAAHTSDISENDLLAPVQQQMFGHHTMPGYRVTSEDAVTMHPATVLSNSNNGSASSNLSAAAFSSFAVLDGHGGRDAADFCAEHLNRVFESCVQNTTSMDPDVQTQVVWNTVLALDEEMGQLSQFQVKKTVLAAAVGTEAAKFKYEARDKSGTTLVWAVMSDSHMLVANVGDSRAVLAQNNAERVVVLSRDHNVNFDIDDVAEKVEDGTNDSYAVDILCAPLVECDDRDSADEAQSTTSSDWKSLAKRDIARVVNAGGCVNDDGYVLPVKSETGEKLAMTRSLGNFIGKQSSELSAAAQAICGAPEIAVHKRVDGVDNFVLLACDGVWDVMSNAEAVKFVADILLSCAPGEVDLDQICHDLCVKCLEKGSEDNITAMLVDLRKLNVNTSSSSSSGKQQKQKQDARRSILADFDDVAAVEAGMGNVSIGTHAVGVHEVEAGIGNVCVSNTHIVDSQGPNVDSLSDGDDDADTVGFGGGGDDADTVGFGGGGDDDDNIGEIRNETNETNSATPQFTHTNKDEQGGPPVDAHLEHETSGVGGMGKNDNAGVPTTPVLSYEEQQEHLRNAAVPRGTGDTEPMTDSDMNSGTAVQGQTPARGLFI